jgi:two-component system, NarL family, nitrate/nitrite response regulator NarL
MSVDPALRPAALTRPVRVVLADDECLFRASLRQLLSVPPSVLRDVYGVDVGAGFEVVGEAGSGQETIQVVRTTSPDLLLVDLSMPCMTGLEAVRGLGGGGEARTIVLAGHMDRTDLLKAVQLGVRGMLLKDAPTEVLFEAIMTVLAGRYWVGATLMTDLLETVRPLIPSADRSAADTPWKLTARERQVLAMVAAAHGNKEIARRFSLSEETVKHHLTRLFAKVGAATRLELAMLATQHGIVADELDGDVHVPVAPADSPAIRMLDA